VRGKPPTARAKRRSSWSTIAPVKYDKLIKEVKERAGIEDRPEAEQTTKVVVQVRADRLTGEEAKGLLSPLPAPLTDTVLVTDQVVPMSVSEFVDTVADELEVSSEEAERRIRAVFDVLQEATTPSEFHDVIVQLPSGYAELVPALAKR
jgi:uncharacterized protein (DUF2267 family)